MSTDNQNMPVDGELAPAAHATDAPEAPVPTAPPVVVVDSVNSSNYQNQRGSAAAVDQPSTQPVATERTKTEQGARSPAKRRGVSAGVLTGTRSLSRSEERKEAARDSSGLGNHVQLLQAQVLELNGRLGALELSHAAGQEAISSFADRLVFENEKLDIRLVELQTATGGHLATIEEAFKKCDAAMTELKAASSAAVSAAAHAAASSSGASPRSGLSPGLTRTDMNLLRVHIDSVAATQLGVADQLVGVGDRFVS